MECNDKMKVVHRNLLVPLFSDHLDQTSKSNTTSVFDQTVRMDEVIAVGVIASHVQIMGAYSRAWVANMFHRGMELLLL